MKPIDQTVVNVASRQHGVFASTQLGGVTKAQVKSRIDSGRWRRVQRGLFVTEGSPATWEQAVWIELLSAGNGAVVGMRTALVLLNGAAGRGPIEIVQPEATVPTRKSRSAYRTTWLPLSHTTRVGGFPVTNYARTLFDLARLASPARRGNGSVHLTEQQVERKLEDALANKRVTVASMATMLGEMEARGRVGTTLIRRLLVERQVGYMPTESVLEDCFVDLLRRFGLPEPSRQVAVGSATKWLGRIDFYYQPEKLIVEADSLRHHGQRSAFVRDHQRDLAMTAEGWQVVRLDWWQLTNDAPTVARRLRQILALRSPR